MEHRSNTPPCRYTHPFATLNTHLKSLTRSLLQTHHHNLSTLLRSPLSEISGSLGDLGTLLPILIALSLNNSISLSSTLVFSGLANIYTGVLFGIPLPVQPMKAIAAVALARNFSKEEIASAGIFVAGAIGVLSLTGLVRWFTNRIPIPVVKGIQLGTGLSLILSAGNLYPSSISSSSASLLNAAVLLICFLALLASSAFRRIPYALIILLLGIIFVGFTDLISDGPGAEGYSIPHFKFWHPQAFVPSWYSFQKGLLEAGIGQLPLTTLNSVIAVAFLAQDLLPEVKAPSTTALGLSVMGINLVGCWFGAMPVCHGSGGLAAQYRFGARSGASIILLGLVKLVLGLFASEIALHIFIKFPSVLLCILVIAAGLELVKVGESLNTAGVRNLNPLDRASSVEQDTHNEDEDKIITGLTERERKRRWAVMFTTVAGILAFRNDAIGFSAGMLCHWSFHWQDILEERTSRRGGYTMLGSQSQEEGDNAQERPSEGTC
ncbi:hypothetical protein JMJ35_000553 [Cladonia borealis]|uniref:Sulfate transporter n=1 Tax=Cladonia borealis TaxID=184061 RepID=A0AA39R9N3_9LECA|nr:hypothetical protein JMJ35_000553 [Cladonia borealis]